MLTYNIMPTFIKKSKYTRFPQYIIKSLFRYSSLGDTVSLSFVDGIPITVLLTVLNKILVVKWSSSFKHQMIPPWFCSGGYHSFLQSCSETLSSAWAPRAILIMTAQLKIVGTS